MAEQSKRHIRKIKYDHITKKEVEKYLNEMFDKLEEKQKNERQFVLYQGCLTYGTVNRSKTIHCGNEECTSCNNFSKIFHEELKKQTN